MASEPEDQRVRGLDSLAVFVFAWVWLALRPEPPLNPDTSRDLAFARDLVEGAELHHHGATTSFAGLEQGTAWIDLLAASSRIGLGITGFDRLLTTLLAFAVAAAHLGLARLLGAAGPRTRPAWIARVAAIAGALAWLVTLPATCEMPILWQPLLAPVPILFAHLAAWRVVDRGELLDCVALGLLAGLAFDLHVVAIVLLVGPLFAVPLAARRPGLATAASVAAWLGLVALNSPAALLDNLAVARERGWLLAGGLGGVGLVALGLVLRPRARARSLTRRLELCVVAEALLVAALVLASLRDGTPGLSGRYLLPFAPAVALAVGLLLVRGGGSRERTLIAAAVIALGLFAARPSSTRRVDDRALPLLPAYSQREFEVIAEALAARDHTWRELVVGLQGPAHAELLGGLATVLDPGDGAQVDAGLIVVALEPERAAAVLAELPPTTTTVELPPGIGTATALVVETSARVDRRGAAICPAEGECVPVSVDVVRRVNQSHPNAWIGAQPLVRWLDERGDGSLTWRFPVRPGPATTVVLPPYNGPRCTWSVVAVDGFELPDATLPTTILELPADVRGTVTISRAYDEADPTCRRDRPGSVPAPVELDPSWAKLRAALTAGR